jgi:hypothetical protein
VSRLDRQVDRFAAALERAGFALMAAGMVGLGLVLFGYLAGWWLLAVALVVAALVARSFLRARAVINAPLTQVDPQRTTVIRDRVTRRRGVPELRAAGEHVSPRRRGALARCPPAHH